MNITEADKILTAVRNGTAKQDGYTAQQIKDAKARMAQFNKNTNNDRTAPLSKKMNKGGYANCGASSPATQGSTKKMAVGGMLKKPDNLGLKKLPTKVRNNMGYMYGGGYAKKK